MTSLEYDVLFDFDSIDLVRKLCRLSLAPSNNNCHVFFTIQVAHGLEDKIVIIKMTKIMDLSRLAGISMQIFVMISKVMINLFKKNQLDST